MQMETTENWEMRKKWLWTSNHCASQHFPCLTVLNGSWCHIVLVGKMSQWLMLKVFVVGKNEIQAKWFQPSFILNFLCLLTLNIHDPWIIRVRKPRKWISTLISFWPTISMRCKISSALILLMSPLFWNIPVTLSGRISFLRGNNSCKPKYFPFLGQN